MENINMGNYLDYPLKELKKIINSKEMLCACYLHKYVHENNFEALQKMKKIIKTLDIEQINNAMIMYNNFQKPKSVNENIKVRTKVKNNRKYDG